MRVPAIAMPILIARSRRVVSGGGGMIARCGGAVSATPSTLAPHRQVMAGGLTRRAHAGQTRINVEDEETAIYRKILT